MAQEHHIAGVGSAENAMEQCFTLAYSSGRLDRLSILAGDLRERADKSAVGAICLSPRQDCSVPTFRGGNIHVQTSLNAGNKLRSLVRPYCPYGYVSPGRM